MKIHYIEINVKDNDTNIAYSFNFLGFFSKQIRTYLIELIYGDFVNLTRCFLQGNTTLKVTSQL